MFQKKTYLTNSETNKVFKQQLRALDENLAGILKNKIVRTKSKRK